MTTKKAVKKAATKRGGKRPGSGRKPGVPNKITREIKEAVLLAFENKGGHKYLERMADEEPCAFMTLLGKILPVQLQAEINAKSDHTVTFQMVYHPATDSGSLGEQERRSVTGQRAELDAGPPAPIDGATGQREAVRRDAESFMPEPEETKLHPALRAAVNDAGGFWDV
jgi:hypothetical protein